MFQLFKTWSKTSGSMFFFSPKHCIPSELVNIPSLGKVNITQPDFTLYGEWERGKPEYTISSYFPADTNSKFRGRPVKDKIPCIFNLVNKV